ncbi:hypothetical protein DOTSEDRAFT_54514 [Dothistroma septosporum NZE10]|uniref:Cryptic loci regulator 2 N-terminal domain-containing protein n=1 Tax=Dothistroma septosporum (strain NZE10 / CBS 128990) TaxID=675120 RepID=N1PHE8_DOTSN|nr:hypothetical protein DOTSEDRAFT_54514 [Dothistroma septosporum NZE10]
MSDDSKHAAKWDPQRYILYLSKREGGEGRVDVRILGHPGAKFFDSYKKSVVHLKHLQDHESWQPCPCALCIEWDRKPQASIQSTQMYTTCTCSACTSKGVSIDTTTSANKDERVIALNDTLLREYWKQMIEQGYRSWDSQRIMMGGLGVDLNRTRDLVTRIWARFQHGTNGWQPLECTKHFKTVLKLIKVSSTFALDVVGGVGNISIAEDSGRSFRKLEAEAQEAASG